MASYQQIYEEQERQRRESGEQREYLERVRGQLQKAQRRPGGPTAIQYKEAMRESPQFRFKEKSRREEIVTKIGEVEKGKGEISEFQKALGEQETAVKGYEEAGYKVEELPEGGYQFVKEVPVTRTVQVSGGGGGAAPSQATIDSINNQIRSISTVRDKIASSPIGNTPTGQKMIDAFNKRISSLNSQLTALRGSSAPRFKTYIEYKKETGGSMSDYLKYRINDIKNTAKFIADTAQQTTEDQTKESLAGSGITEKNYQPGSKITIYDYKNVGTELSGTSFDDLVKKVNEKTKENARRYSSDLYRGIQTTHIQNLISLPPQIQYLVEKSDPTTSQKIETSYRQYITDAYAGRLPTTPLPSAPTSIPSKMIPTAGEALISRLTGTTVGQTRERGWGVRLPSTARPTPPIIQQTPTIRSERMLNRNIETAYKTLPQSAQAEFNIKYVFPDYKFQTKNDIDVFKQMPGASQYLSSLSTKEQNKFKQTLGNLYPVKDLTTYGFGPDQSRSLWVLNYIWKNYGRDYWFKGKYQEPGAVEKAMETSLPATSLTIGMPAPKTIIEPVQALIGGLAFGKGEDFNLGLVEQDIKEHPEWFQKANSEYQWSALIGKDVGMEAYESLLPAQKLISVPYSAARMGVGLVTFAPIMYQEIGGRFLGTGEARGDIVKSIRGGLTGEYATGQYKIPIWHDIVYTPAKFLSGKTYEFTDISQPKGALEAGTQQIILGTAKAVGSPIPGYESGISHEWEKAMKYPVYSAYATVGEILGVLAGTKVLGEFSKLRGKGYEFVGAKILKPGVMKGLGYVRRYTPYKPIFQQYKPFKIAGEMVSRGIRWEKPTGFSISEWTPKTLARTATQFMWGRRKVLSTMLHPKDVLDEIVQYATSKPSETKARFEAARKGELIQVTSGTRQVLSKLEKVFRELQDLKAQQAINPLSDIYSPLNKVEFAIVNFAKKTQDLILTGSRAMKLQSKSSFAKFTRKMGDWDFIIQGDFSTARRITEALNNYIFEITGKKFSIRELKHKGTYRIFEKTKKGENVIVDVTSSMSKNQKRSFPTSVIEGVRVASLDHLLWNKIMIATHNKPGLQKTLQDIAIITKEPKTKIGQIYRGVKEKRLIPGVEKLGKYMPGLYKKRIWPKKTVIGEALIYDLRKGEWTLKGKQGLYVTPKGELSLWSLGLRGARDITYKLFGLGSKVKSYIIETGAKRIIGPEDVPKTIVKKYQYIKWMEDQAKIDTQTTLYPSWKGLKAFRKGKAHPIELEYTLPPGYELYKGTYRKPMITATTRLGKLWYEKWGGFIAKYTGVQEYEVVKGNIVTLQQYKTKVPGRPSGTLIVGAEFPVRRGKPVSFEKLTEYRPPVTEYPIITPYRYPYVRGEGYGYAKPREYTPKIEYQRPTPYVSKYPYKIEYQRQLSYQYQPTPPRPEIRIVTRVTPYIPIYPRIDVTPTRYRPPPPPPPEYGGKVEKKEEKKKKKLTYGYKERLHKVPLLPGIKAPIVRQPVKGIYFSIVKEV